MPTQTNSLGECNNTTPELDNPWVLRSIDIATRLDDELQSAEGIIPGHSAMRDIALTDTMYRHLKIDPTSTLLHKTDPNPDREYSSSTVNPLQIEVAGTNFFRVLSPKHCSRAYIVVNEASLANSCVIERIPNFRTIDQIHQHKDLGLTKEEDLLNKGITPLLVYNFLLQNNDFRTGNMGLMGDEKFMAIDFDQALWSYPTCALFDTPLQPGQEPKPFDMEKFPLTLSDIENFPILKDANPTHWPTRDIQHYNPTSLHDQRDQAFADLLKSLKNNPEFITQKYFCLFKFSILFHCKMLIACELSKSMHPESNPFKIIIDSLHNRALQLQHLLLVNEKFEPHLKKVNEWFSAIKIEITSTHPGIEEALDDSFGNYYNTYAIKATESAAPLIRRASDAAQCAEQDPERKNSLNRTKLRTEKERENLSQLASTLDRLLEKHKKYILKIEKYTKTHPDKQPLEFCETLRQACKTFDTETISRLLPQAPKIKLGFFNWFSNSPFRHSVGHLIQIDAYQAVSQQRL